MKLILSFFKNAINDCFEDLDSWQINGYSLYCGFGFVVFGLVQWFSKDYNPIFALRIIGVIFCTIIFLSRKKTQHSYFKIIWFTAVFYNNVIFFPYLFLTNINNPLAFFDFADMVVVLLFLLNTRVYVLFFIIGLISTALIKCAYFSELVIPNTIIYGMISNVILISGYCIVVKVGKRRIHKEQLRTANLLSGMIFHELRHLWLQWNYGLIVY